VEALENERVAQTNLAAYVSRAALAIESSLQEVNNYAATLHGVAVDLSDFARLLPSLPGSLQRELTGLLNAHTVAAADISEASRALLVAGEKMEQTMQNMAASSTSANPF
jgi:hypothetical protein